MKYEKAKLIAKNLPSGSYAAGCPVKTRGRGCWGLDFGGMGPQGCKACERTK